MTRRIGLALTLHNHQPVGNFGWVIAETYERAYLPMLEALERHPDVRLALHYTGPLLAWLRAERPDFVERLKALADRRQVEIVGGGWYEPVLAALPERDRVGQLVRMADELESVFGARPRGAWLAERVWEPDLPTSLVTAGYEWTVLDDAHFRAAAIPEEALWGPYTTDDQGKVLTVFGTEQGLRYRIPFWEVDEVIGYLRDHATEAGDRVGTMGDDGEKFGGWPTTYEYCWGETRWVERFFEALEANRDWLTTVTPSDWIDEHRPIGRVYLPTGSYAEMGEWALPADEAVAYADAVHRARDEGRPEARWLRGAIWRNFQVKYREVNDLHKQMLRASDLVEAMPDGPDREQARDDLYAGQSNDCYWHGLFGGIYLPDLRVAALRRLIEAEDAALRAAATVPASGVLVDLDLDGRDEVLLVDDGQVVGIKLDEGAGIGRWDLRATAVPLAAVMRRRPEAYHEKLRAHEAAAGGGAAPTAAAGSGGGPASIHDIVTAKQEGLTDRLVYDRSERRSGLVRLFPIGTSAEDVAAGTAEDLVRAVDGAWSVDEIGPRAVTASYAERGLRIAKTVSIGGSRTEPTLRVEVDVLNEGRETVEAILAVEFNLMLLGGGHNPSAWYEIDGERLPHDERRTASGIGGLRAANEQLGVVIETTLGAPADAWIAPIETVSNSEAGFELVYQGSALVLGRSIRIGPGETASLGVIHAVRPIGPAVDSAPVAAAAATPSA